VRPSTLAVGGCLPKNDGVEGVPAKVKSKVGERGDTEIERAPTLLPVHGHINISPSVFLLLSCQVETRLGIAVVKPRVTASHSARLPIAEVHNDSV
jgi:hypothetical protein